MKGPIKIETASWGRRELATILTGLAGRAAGKNISLLEREAARRLSTRVFALNSGRGALALALRFLATDGPKRRRVLIPEYVCPAVPETILELGLEPVAVAVGRDLNMREAAAVPALDDTVLAVITVHMYAHLLPLTILTEAAAKAGAAIIDNAAHVVGQTRPDGTAPGTAGAFGLVSFAQSKSLVCGNSGAGGLLLVNDARYLRQAELEIESLPRARAESPLRYWAAARKISARPDYFWRLSAFMRATRGRPASLATSITRIADVHAALALDQLASLDRRIADKQRIATEYVRALRGSRLGLCQLETGRYLTRVMLEAPSPAERDRLRAGLARAGIATRAGYPPPEAIMVTGGRPRAFAVFEVPSGYGLSTEAIGRVAEELAKLA